MNVLVFATVPITPEQWSDFAHTAAGPAQSTGPGKPMSPPLCSYVLVHSRSQQDYLTETGFQIPATVKTEFSNATYKDLHAFMCTLPEEHFRKIHSHFFMILDAQALSDRTVRLIHHNLELVDREGNIDDYVDDHEGDPEWTEKVCWRLYRLKWEEIWEFYAVMKVKIGLALEREEGLEEVVLEDVEEEQGGEETGE